MLGWSRWLVAAATEQDWKPEGRVSFGYRVSPKWQGCKPKLGFNAHEGSSCFEGKGTGLQLQHCSWGATDNVAIDNKGK